MLTHRGIPANHPNKGQTILDMRSLKNLKEAQSLAGRIASLSRFLPRIVQKAKPVMNLLKKWNEKCKQTFWQLDITLATPIVLTKPSTSKKLIVYLSVFVEATNTILDQEQDSGLRPIYFVSQRFDDK